MISIIIHAVKGLRVKIEKSQENVKRREAEPTLAVWSDTDCPLKGPTACPQQGEGAGMTQGTCLPDRGNSKGKRPVEASVPAVWQPTWQRKRTAHLLPA